MQDSREPIETYSERGLGWAIVFGLAVWAIAIAAWRLVVWLLT